MFSYTGSTALVTGASSGIGAAFARELAARRIAALVLVARSTDKLEALARELRSKYGVRVEVIPADLSDEDSFASIKAETEQRGLAIDLLINNAGVGSYGLFDQTFEPHIARHKNNPLAVNVRALVELTGAYLPGMIARGRGSIINVASTAAFQPTPYTAVYGASKAFVLSFSEALWAENRKRGVRIVCLCPGITDTGFGFGLGEQPPKKFALFPQSTSAEVARVGLQALEGNASYVVVGRANYVMALGARFAPHSLLARLVANILRPDSLRRRSTPVLSKAILAMSGTTFAGVLAGAVLLRYLAGRRKT